MEAHGNRKGKGKGKGQRKNKPEQKYKRGPLKLLEIQMAALATVKALRAGGFACCVFGSAACTLYGMKKRVPKDVDLVFLTEIDPELIKRFVVNSTNDEFFLATADTTYHNDTSYASQNPDEPLQVLRYCLPTPIGYGTRSCKVDILIPANSAHIGLNIPTIPLERIMHKEAIPLMPFFALLLMKLQGWKDRRDLPAANYGQKQIEDVADMKKMLLLATEEGADYHLADPLERWMPEWFVRQAEQRIVEFLGAVPESLGQWRAMGFLANNLAPVKHEPTDMYCWG